MRRPVQEEERVAGVKKRKHQTKARETESKREIAGNNESKTVDEV